MLFREKPLRTYLILANGITWAIWVPTLLFARAEGFILPSPDQATELFRAGFTNSQHILLAILFSLGPFGPFIASLVATKMESGTAGLAALKQRILHWRAPLKWYSATIGIAASLALIPFLFGALTKIINIKTITWGAVLLSAGPLLLFQIFTSGLGEEPGWRGYLLPKLENLYPGEKSIWVLGLIWAIWHYPFTIFWSLATPLPSDVPSGAIIFMILLSLAGQTISLIGIAFLYTWLYHETGSVFLAIIFHALSNVLPALLGVSAYPQLSLIAGLSPWLLVMILQKVVGKPRFPGVKETTT